MAFQPVPSQADLQASIPAGRLAVAMRPYAHPVPAFGPGSVEYARKKTEELELLQKDNDADALQTDSTTANEGGTVGGGGGGGYAADRPYY